MWQGASGAAGRRRRGNEREAEGEGARKREGSCVFVWKERERVSVQAREIVWRGREGSVSQSQHLSFSLHQGWGTLRPLASLAADLTPFHQRSHLFFFLAFYLLLLTALLLALRSSLSVWQDIRIYLLKTWVARNYKGDICRGQWLKLRFRLGYGLSLYCHSGFPFCCSASVLFRATDILREELQENTSTTKQSAYFKGLREVRKSMVTLRTWGEGAWPPLPMLLNVTTKMQILNLWD